MFKSEHPDTANFYRALAEVYSRQNDFPKALEFFEKTLEIRKKIFGTEDYSKALPLYLRGYDILCKTLGVDNEKTKSILGMVQKLQKATSGQ